MFVKPVFAVVSLIFLAIDVYDSVWYQVRALASGGSGRLYDSPCPGGVHGEIASGHPVAGLQRVVLCSTIRAGKGTRRSLIFFYQVGDDNQQAHNVALLCSQLLFYIATSEQLSAFHPVWKFFAVRAARAACVLLQT